MSTDVNDKNYFFGQVNFQVDTCVCSFHYNANATGVSGSDRHFASASNLLALTVALARILALKC